MFAYVYYFGGAIISSSGDIMEDRAVMEPGIALIMLGMIVTIPTMPFTRIFSSYSL